MLYITIVLSYQYTRNHHSQKLPSLTIDKTLHYSQNPCTAFLHTDVFFNISTEVSQQMSNQVSLPENVRN